jgi:hypothetical protein
MKLSTSQSKVRKPAISTRRGFEFAILLVNFLLKKSNKEKSLYPRGSSKVITTIAVLILIICLTVSKVFAQIANEFETDSLTTATFISAYFINASEGWLADNAGKLWHTTNAGETWNSTVTEKNFLQPEFTDALTGFGITANGVYKTTNGGSAWSTLTLPGTYAGSLHFLDGNTGFIGGSEVIY